MAHDLEIRVAHQMRNIRPPPGKVIVDAQDIMTIIQKSGTKVTSQKPGAAGDQYSLCRYIHPDILMGPVTLIHTTSDFAYAKCRKSGRMRRSKIPPSVQ